MAGRTPDLADLTVDIGPPGDPNTPKTIKARAKLTRLDYIAVDPLADRHQCLIVRVRSELDEPLFLEQAQPGVYRHWAQENLSYQPTPANEIQSIGFDGVIERLIRRLDRGSYVDLDAEVSLGEFPKELTGKNALVVSLKEQEIRPLFLNFMLHSELKLNTFGVLQVLQRRMPTEKEKPDDPALIIGGIAVVVLPVK
ncbi:MAG: hypothetical protein E5V99_17120 [Mesorhizobium sp.]|nr:MAG: hypothetical protein E5V99_17120 [Mesorhizobium sp.]